MRQQPRERSARRAVRELRKGAKVKEGQDRTGKKRRAAEEGGMSEPCN